ncbi:DNA-binding transcriptional regulator RstA [Klebsiella michiganensis]|nr:DNA-binding transcriptional regulator RstA [Klebsiella michiganensis]
MNKIVFVEDDAEVGALIAAYLGKHDMDVVVEPRGDRAEEVIAREKPDLVLLDIMLPGKDGMTLCRDLRGQWQGPIVLLTSLDSDMNHILSLEMGASDYILKTTPPAVLLARLRLHLRQHIAVPDGSVPSSLTPHKAIAFGSLSIDPVNRQVMLGGESVALSTADFRSPVGVSDPCWTNYGSGRVIKKSARRQLRWYGPQRRCRHLAAA